MLQTTKSPPISPSLQQSKVPIISGVYDGTPGVGTQEAIVERAKQVSFFSCQKTIFAHWNPLIRARSAVLQWPVCLSEFTYPGHIFVLLGPIWLRFHLSQTLKWAFLIKICQNSLKFFFSKPINQKSITVMKATSHSVDLSLSKSWSLWVGGATIGEGDGVKFLHRYI